MKSKWLQQGAHPDLLVFWNGWGMDDRPFEHLSAKAHDVLMIYDYRDPALPDDLVRSEDAYCRIRQVAWSFGVWAAGTWAKTAPANASFDLAMNGTSAPIHAQYGIPPEAFDEMASQLTPERRDLFYRDMFTNEEEAVRFFNQPPNRAFAEQHEELLAVQAAPAPQPAPFVTALVSGRDRIVPARSQLRFWKGRGAMRKAESGHFPFYLWQTWEDLLSHDSQR